MLHLPTPDERRLIERHIGDDPHRLALSLKSTPTVDRDFVVRQIAGLQTLQRKVPQWAEAGVTCPPHLPLEQCSSQATAAHKATLVGGTTLVDLTGGLGIDFAFMLKKFEQGTYVEQQPVLCEMARHNFELLHIGHAEVVCADACEYARAPWTADCIYIDPARRNSAGSKTVLLADCTPDISALAPQLLLKAPTVMAKLSPMLDISMALRQLPSTAEVHVVAVGGECKELLFVMKAGHSGEPEIVCTDISRHGTSRFRFTQSGEAQAAVAIGLPGAFIYEPNASVLKAGAYKSVAHAYGLTKLNVNSHLYTSERPVGDFPGRVFRTQAVFAPNRREIREHLSDISQANIATRNFPMSVAELRRRLKLGDGGPDYIFATTDSANRHILIRCRRLEPQNSCNENCRD